jgi:hypothetical protein
MHTTPNAATSTSKNWIPYHALAVMGIWLALVMLIAFSICSCGGGTPPPPANGSISLAWSLTDARGRPATCAQVGARSVALRLRNHAGGDVVATAFPCEASPGTAQVAAGVYDVASELHTPDGTSLATAPAQTGVSIVAGRVKTLTPVTFAVIMQGTMVLSIATPTTTNCQSTSAGGAGITATTLTLEAQAGGCAAVTFVRARGTTQLGTYTVNCSSPQIARCIEKDETLTTSLASGTYLVHARGKIGAIDCWQRDDTLVVPPLGKPLIHTLGLTHVNVPGC